MEDSFAREIHYLRLSVSDRCNYRCSYCLPRAHRDFTTPTEWLTPGETVRIVGLFAGLGIAHVRLTGGEPTVRKELVEISEGIAALPGIKDLSLSTNASRLAQLAAPLINAGIKRLNISLDSIDPVRFNKLTGGQLQPVLDGIAAAREVGFAPIKINTVALRGVNEDELERLVDFCLRNELTLRFIEVMPVGAGGQSAQAHYMPLAEIETALRKRFRLQPAAMQGSGPARYFQVDSSGLLIGFITPQSQHFCASCNRVRLNVRGDLHLCLGQENRVPLGEMLRAGATNTELEAAILDGIAKKPRSHDFTTEPTAILRPMSALGG